MNLDALEHLNSNKAEEGSAARDTHTHPRAIMKTAGLVHACVWRQELGSCAILAGSREREPSPAPAPEGKNIEQVGYKVLKTFCSFALTEPGCFLQGDSEWAGGNGLLNQIRTMVKIFVEMENPFLLPPQTDVAVCWVLQGRGRGLGVIPLALFVVVELCWELGVLDRTGAGGTHHSPLALCCLLWEGKGREAAQLQCVGRAVELSPVLVS